MNEIAIELLHAAARRQVSYSVTGSGAVVSQYHHRDVTDEANELIEAGLLRKLDGLRFLVPTDAAREVYSGDDKCPQCGAWERQLGLPIEERRIGAA